MNLQNQLDQFCDDNPYDVNTQAKRLLAKHDNRLLLYVLTLGLMTARTRRRHNEREYIKNVGQAPPSERLVSGRVTGSVKIVPSKKTRNAMTQMILDVWRVNGETKLGDATGNDLAIASQTARASAAGQEKNAVFYDSLKKDMGPKEKVREQWTEDSVRSQIEKVYGEFRKSEAA
jgi:hypothetical protein